MPTNPEPRPRPSATPEIEPPAGTPPKRFPEHPTPLSADQLDPASKSTPNAAEGPGGDSSRVGGGEDPDIESGTDKNDPEQQAAGDDGVEKSFE